MKNPKRKRYSGQLTCRIGPDVEDAMALSGETRADWIRKAAQMRLDQENRNDAPLDVLKGKLNSLQHYLNELTAEIKTLKNDQAKTHITALGTQSEVVNLSKQSAFVRQNQLELTHVLNQMDKNFSHAVTQLGPSLLLLLSEKLRDLIQAEIAKAPPKPKPLPPLPPRNL